MTRQMQKFRLQVTENYEALCRQVAKNILSLSEKAISEQGRFTLLLSGGAAPRGVYALMAGRDCRGRFQWQNIHFFWGDERYLPPEDPKSNYRMVAETLLTQVDIPPENIHPMRTGERTPEIAAEHYEEELASFFKLKKGEFPRFDLALLGLGSDGHTASLFSGHPALLEARRLVVPVFQKNIDPPQRITVTLSLINEAETIFFLVSGHEKAAVLKTVLEGQRDTILPAQRVKPSRGEIFWYTDQAAAARLDQSRRERI